MQRFWQQQAAVWRKLHWSDLVLLAMLCAVPIISAYKIWANASGLLKYMSAVVLLGMIARRRVVDEARDFTQQFRSLPGLLIVVTIAYALMSSLWAPNIAYSVTEALRTIWIVASAAIVAWRLAAVPNATVVPWFVAATAVGLILLLIDMGSGHSAIESMYGIVRDLRVNPNIVTLSLLIWPAVGMMISDRRIVFAAIVWVLAGVVVALGPSGAAVLGYMLGSAILALSLWSASLAVWFAYCSAMAGLLLAPLLGSAATVFMSSIPTQWLQTAYPWARIEIWLQNAELIGQAPLVGTGFKSLKAIHPHNFALQVWVEFGLVGVVLAAALITSVAVALWRSANPLKGFMLAGAVAIYANAYVSYGMWESPWLSIELLAGIILVWGLAGSRETHRISTGR